MGNSIEEDIKILEDFSNENVLYGSTVGMTLEKYKDLQLSTEHILSDYKRVLKENEILKEEKAQAWEEWNNLEQGSYETEQRLKKENETLKEYIAKAPNLDEMTAIKYRNIQQEAYIQGRAEEQKKAEQIINENYIPVQKVQDKIEKKIKYHEKNILDIENITMLKSKTVKEEAEIEFNKYAIVVLKKMLRELIEESDKKIKRVEKSTRIERLL